MATYEKQLYKRDPEAWNAHLVKANAHQARKRVAADVIARDEDDRLLIVNPTYKPDWDLPGGMVEANEPPIDAACRELREELGLGIEMGALLCVDWMAPYGPWDDTLVFVFDGGILPAARIDTLKVTDDELSDFRFCTHDEAAVLLSDFVWKRAAAALEALTTGRTQYIQRCETIF
jgi:ADP-ribose pyrophosphatase YjhB (NUDIX family)